jgi:hypothetical protein
MQELEGERYRDLIWSEKRRKETAQGDLRSLRSRSVSWVLFCVVKTPPNGNKMLERDRATEERESLRKERELQRKREIASISREEMLERESLATEKKRDSIYREERRESLLVSGV